MLSQIKSVACSGKRPSGRFPAAGGMRGTMVSFRRLLMSLAVLLLGALPAVAQASISSLSGPPEYASGGKVRLQIRGPAASQLEQVLTMGSSGISRNLAGEFELTGPGVFEGVLRGLPEGSTIVRATLGGSSVSMVVTNHPQTGPMFAGPKQEVFLCATESHRAAAQLGEVLDADCSMETRVDFLYMSLDSGELEAYEPGITPASDVALTTTLEGSLVPYIVRWERGTINRFIYSIAMLSPASQDPFNPDLSAWNGRAIYQFQGGVGIGHYQGSPSFSNMMSQPGLADGYAI